MIVLIYQKRSDQINLSEVGSVFFASSSIGGGTKLIYSTLLFLNVNLIESDKLYTIYGGFCVIWISFSALKRKLKPLDKK